MTNYIFRGHINLPFLNRKKLNVINDVIKNKNKVIPFSGLVQL